jgi:hypothetical protein
MVAVAQRPKCTCLHDKKSTFSFFSSLISFFKSTNCKGFLCSSCSRRRHGLLIACTASKRFRQLQILQLSLMRIGKGARHEDAFAIEAQVIENK